MAKLLLAAFLCSTLTIVYPYVLRVNLPTLVLRHEKTAVNPDIEAETISRQKPQVPIDLVEEAKRESQAAKRRLDVDEKSKAALKDESGGKLSKDKSNLLHILKNKKTPVRGDIPQDSKTGLEKSLLGSQDSAEFADSTVLKPKTFWFTLDGNQKAATSNRLPFVDHEELVENEIMPDNAKGSSVSQNDVLTRSIVNKKQGSTKAELEHSSSSVGQAKADGNSKAEKDDSQKGSSVQTGHYLNQKEIEGDVLKKSEDNAGNKPVSTIAQQSTSIVDEEEGGASDTQKAAETVRVNGGNDVVKSPSNADSGETRSVGQNDTELTENIAKMDDDEDKADLEEEQHEDSKTFKETGVDDNETIDTATGDTVEANMENNSAAKQITDEVAKSESSLNNNKNSGSDSLTEAGSKNENVESSGSNASDLEELGPGEFAGESEDSEGTDTENKGLENSDVVEGKTAKEDKVDDNEYIDTDTGDEVALDNDGTGNAEGFEENKSDTADSNVEAAEAGQENKESLDSTTNANQNNETKSESGNDKVESALGDVNNDNETTVQDFTESKAGSSQGKSLGDENKSDERELQSFKEDQAGSIQEKASHGENKNNETKVQDFNEAKADNGHDLKFSQEEQKAIEAAKSYNKTNSEKQKIKGVARHQLEGTTVREFASSGTGKDQAKLDHKTNVKAENEKVDSASSEKQNNSATEENKKGNGVARHQLEGMTVNEFASLSSAGDKTDLSKTKNVRIESNGAQSVAKNVKAETAGAQKVSQEVKSESAEVQKVSKNIKAGSIEAQKVANNSKQASEDKTVSSFARMQLEGMDLNEFTSTHNRGYVNKAASVDQGEKVTGSEEKTEFGDADVRDEFGLKPTPPVMLDSFMEDAGKLNDDKETTDGGNSTEKVEFAGDKTESETSNAKESETKGENQFDSKVAGSGEQALNETELGEGAKSENLDLNVFNNNEEKSTEKTEFASDNAESVSNADNQQQGRSGLQFDSKEPDSKEETLNERQLEEGMKSNKDAKSFKEKAKLEAKTEKEPHTKSRQEINNKKVESEGEILSDRELGETVKSEKDDAKSFDKDENLEAAETKIGAIKENNKTISKEFKNQNAKSQSGLEISKEYSGKDNMEFMDEKNSSVAQKPAGADSSEGSAVTPFGDIEKQKNNMLKQVEGILNTDTMEEKDLDAFVDNATAQAARKGSSMEEFAAGEDDVKEDNADKEQGSSENVDKGKEEAGFDGSAGKKEKEGVKTDQNKERKSEAAEAFQLKTSEDSKTYEAKLEFKNLTSGVKDLDKEFASKVSIKKDTQGIAAPLREAAKFDSKKGADMKSVVKEAGKVAQNNKASNAGNIAVAGSLKSSGNKPEKPVKDSKKAVETSKQSSEPAKEIWDLGPDNNPVSKSSKSNDSKSYDKPAKKSPIAGENEEFGNGPAFDKKLFAETFPNPEIATSTETSASSSGNLINTRLEYGDIKPKPMKDEFGKETNNIANSVPEQKGSSVDETTQKDSNKVDELKPNSVAASLIKENALKIKKEFEDIKDTVFKPEKLFDKRSELNVLQSKIDAAKRLYKHYNSDKSV